MFTNIILYKQLRVTCKKKICLRNLETPLIWQTALKSEHEPLAKGNGARTTRLERWSTNHSVSAMKCEPLAQGDGA